MRWLVLTLALLGSLSVVADVLPTYRGVSAVSKTSNAKFVLFGDSLSDNGNTYEYSHHTKPSASAYYQGRYSNGPIWIDYVLTILFPNSSKQRLLNYAFGGAGVLRSQPHVFVLSQEIDSYLLTHVARPDADTWFVMWIGANDYLLHPDSSAEDVHKVIAEMERNIVRLVQQGAKHVIVMGLPDLGLLPYAEDLEVQAPLSTLTKLHNAQFKLSITKLQARFPQADWHYIDIDQTFTSLIAHPKQYGFKRTHERCLEPNISGKKTWISKKQTDCRQYVFFDQFHPTTYVHQIVAKELLKNIKL